MKKITIFETVDELLHGFQSDRTIDDNSPFIPFSVSLIYNNDCLGFIGEDSDKFHISSDVRYWDLVDRVFEIQGVRFNITQEQLNEQK